MDSTEYAPGTAAIATVHGRSNVRVMRTTGAGGADIFWVSDEIISGARGHCPADVTDVRPLVVLEIGDLGAVVKALRAGASYAAWVADASALLPQLADQIEAQTKPPRIPEPTECGATVIACQVGEDSGSDRLWVRFRHGSKGCWIDQYEHVRSWSDLDNPRAQDCEGDR